MTAGMSVMGTAGNLPALPVFLLEGLHEHPAASAHDQAIRALVERTVGAVGTPLLSARSTEEVSDRIDDVLESGALLRAGWDLRVGFERLGLDLQTLALDLDVDSLDLPFAPDVTRQVRGALTNELRQAEAMQRLVQAYESTGERWRDAMAAQQAQAFAPGADPLRFITTAPLPVARVLMSAARGSVASFGIVSALLDPDHDSAQLSILAELWLRGSYDGLRWLALFHDAAIPLEMVPAADRISEAIVQAVHAETARISELCEAYDRGELPAPDPSLD